MASHRFKKKHKITNKWANQENLSAIIEKFAAHMYKVITQNKYYSGFCNLIEKLCLLHLEKSLTPQLERNIPGDILYGFHNHDTHKILPAKSKNMNQIKQQLKRSHG